MRSSTAEQYGSWAEVAGFQSSSPASWRSSSASSNAANGASSSPNQPAADSASNANQPQFGSMMATLLQAHGIASGANGSPLSSGVSDDVQFVSGQTTGGSGTPLLANLQSLLSILSDRGAASTATNSTGASSTSTGSAALDNPNAIPTNGLQGVANGIVTNASSTIRPSTDITASASSAASSGSTAQTSPPPWAAGWFNVGASTEAATTGWADAFGQQNGTTLNQQFAQAAAAYAATDNTSNTSPVTNVTA